MRVRLGVKDFFVITWLFTMHIGWNFVFPLFSRLMEVCFCFGVVGLP